MSELQTNSPEWWERYFAEHWSERGGPDQTRYFMQVLLDALPPVLRDDLAAAPGSVLDWGCAFGEGVALLAAAFPACRVAGLDASLEAIEEGRRRHPELELLHDERGHIPERFDVVLTSNCLEHFERPLELAREHLAQCARWYLVLVPYAEDPLDPTHVSRFDDSSFPARLEDFERVHTAVLPTDPVHWTGGQLLVVYARREHAPRREPSPMNSQQALSAAEQEKWDRIYENQALADETPAVEAFNEEFGALVASLLPGGGKVLEAGCGGASQGLAIARRAGMEVELLDFSEAALRVARARFERHGVPTSTQLGDVFEPGEPEYDLTFNAGALEHFELPDQIRFLQGLESRSRRFVIALVPNRQCAWYWLWRVQSASRGGWPYGKEAPATSLRECFEGAGLHFVGEAILGNSWTEEFIGELVGVEPELKELMLRVHRSPVVPAEQRGYLLVAIGSRVAEDAALVGPWSPGLAEGTQREDSLVASLADALAAGVAGEQRLQSERGAHATTGAQLAHERAILEQTRAAIAGLAAHCAALVAAEGDAGNECSPTARPAELLASVGASITVLDDSLSAERRELDSQRAARAQAEAELAALRVEASGAMWRILRGARATRRALVPEGSLRHRCLRGLSHPVRSTRRVSAALARRLGLPTAMSPYAWCFDRFLERRDANRLGDVAPLRTPGVPGRLSIILPVYNGEDYVAEVIESVLAQTRPDWELVIVDDGSTDASPAILARYAALDERIRVVHQENQKLPRALARGFREATGEFLTWTSADNRLKPDFAARMVGCLERHSSWDAIYANQDLIDASGAPLRGSEWFSGYQVPRGSEHVHLPTDPSELNVWPNNYVGASFAYRARVPFLVGDYSPHLFGLEDYDYWMRVNESLALRHADFDDPVTDYRFHESSLTARDEELGITRRRTAMMVFEEFRRDYLLQPSAWVVTCEPGEEALAAEVRERLEEKGRILLEPSFLEGRAFARLWFPAVHLHVTSAARAAASPELEAPAGFLRALVARGPDLPTELDEAWSLALALDVDGAPPRCARPWQGWLAADDLGAVLRAVETRCRTEGLGAIEDEVFEPAVPRLELSVIVCTYKRPDLVERTLRALAEQELDAPVPHEVLVVDNDPASGVTRELVDELRRGPYASRPNDLRLIDCPLPGLSFARNFGISEARGRILSFLDDDSVPRADWLRTTVAAFDCDPVPGVVGGRIQLRAPEPPPEWLQPDWYVYWSHFDRPDAPGREVTGREVTEWWDYPYGANWSCLRAAIVAAGGFRGRYGRKGKDFGGGEETVAAHLIRELGYPVVIDMRSVVEHAVDAERFTLDDVQKTIRAAVHVNYQCAADLYLPSHSASGDLGRALNQALRALAPGISWPERRRRLAYARAHSLVFRRQLRDRRLRRRRPHATR